MKSNLTNSVYSVIYGGIIGDALGVPFEFCPRGSFTATDMTGGGSYGLPAGTWSDDTSLTLCLIQNIIQDGTPDTLLKKFLLWLEKGKYTARGVMFDVGLTTQEAVLRYKSGTPDNLCGSSEENQNGNGSLMRIAPLAFVLSGVTDFIQRAKTVKQYAEITHRHPRSILACILYIELLIEMLNGKTPEESLKAACDLCRSNLAGTVYETEFPHYARLFDGSIKTAHEDTIESSGYVVHTLEAAIWVCLNSTNIKEAILKAVNLGEDTDTIGSIAGSIAGMQYKTLQDLPEAWIKTIARKKAIDKLLNRFLLKIRRNAGELNSV